MLLEVKVGCLFFAPFFNWQKKNSHAVIAEPSLGNTSLEIISQESGEFQSWK